jgi:hypothetical protein
LTNELNLERQHIFKYYFLIPNSARKTNQKSTDLFVVFFVPAKLVLVLAGPVFLRRNTLKPKNPKSEVSKGGISGRLLTLPTKATSSTRETKLHILRELIRKV